LLPDAEARVFLGGGRCVEELARRRHGRRIRTEGLARPLVVEIIGAAWCWEAVRGRSR
jgi:hypothetical protein